MGGKRRLLYRCWLPLHFQITSPSLRAASWRQKREKIKHFPEDPPSEKLSHNIRRENKCNHLKISLLNISHVGFFPLQLSTHKCISDPTTILKLVTNLLRQINRKILSYESLDKLQFHLTHCTCCITTSVCVNSFLFAVAVNVMSKNSTS